MIAQQCLTEEIAALLKAACGNHIGRACYPYEKRKHHDALIEMERQGWIFGRSYVPMITEKGRAAIGECDGVEAGRRRFIAACKTYRDAGGKPQPTMTFDKTGARTYRPRGRRPFGDTA